MKSIILFLTLLIFTAGCADNSDRIAPDTQGRNIKIGMIGSPENLNPFIAQTQNTTEIRDILFRNLYDWDEKWEMVPQLAKTLPYYSDSSNQKLHSGNLSMKILLSPSKRWSNGVYISGGDFVFANQVAIYPTISQVNDWWLSKIHKLQSASEYELEFSIQTSDYSFIPYFKPLPKYAIENNFFNKTKLFMTNPSKMSAISCGPYTIKNVSMAQEKITNVKLVRNEEFTDKKPSIASLEFCYYSKESFESALFAGGFDFVPHLTFEQAKLIEQGELKDKFNISYYENSWLHILYLNTENLTDLNLRKAIFKSIDRKELSENFHSGKADVAMSYIHKKNPAFVPSFKDEKESLSDLFSKAGYKKSENGIWAKKGNELVLKIACKDIPLNKDILKNLEKQFENAGIKIERFKESADNKKIQPDLILDVNNTAPMLNPIEKISGPKNISNWSNEKSKEIYSSYTSNIDPDTRKKLILSHQNLVAEELPCIPLFFDIAICASKNDIQNVAPRGFGSNMWNVEYWEDQLKQD